MTISCPPHCSSLSSLRTPSGAELRGQSGPVQPWSNRGAAPAASAVSILHVSLLTAIAAALASMVRFRFG